MPSEQETKETSGLEAMAEMAPQEPAFLPIDEAEESIALNNFYKMRTIGLRAALRREQEQVKVLTERLALAEKGVEEVREEIAKLTAANAAKAPDKVPYVPADGKAI